MKLKKQIKTSYDSNLIINLFFYTLKLLNYSKHSFSGN